MREFKDKSLAERLQTAAQAKQEQLRKLRAALPRPDDPAVIERRAAQKALAEAREARIAAKALAERERAEREAAERTEQADRAAAAAREAREIASRPIVLTEEQKAAQKAARDARYAARKSRKK